MTHSKVHLSEADEFWEFFVLIHNAHGVGARTLPEKFLVYTQSVLYFREVLGFKFRPDVYTVLSGMVSTAVCT